jgi:hypothetical protein
MFIIKYAFIVILEFSYELYCQGLNMNTTFHSRTVHLDIIKFLLPTDAQENCFERRIKMYIKTAPTYTSKGESS